MSLKEFTKEIFTRYGLTEDDIKVYLMYLRTPRATISEAYLSFAEGEIEYAKVEEITQMLVEKNFLKKIDGVVNRYIPLEPYFELFTNESEKFRTEIAKIKDNALGDQSNRFDKLETIQNNSIKEVENAVASQIEDFFTDSDKKNGTKKQYIDKATSRFSDTTKTLENNIHSICDNLNADIKTISESFVDNNEREINSGKDSLNIIVAELLNDFTNRVSGLEKELKKDLDNHVDRHETTANELKPKLEQILEKYIERMDKVVTDLKNRISSLLTEHIKHVKSTTNKVESDVNISLDERHLKLREQINSYRDRALSLLENLLVNSNKFSDFSEDITKQGLFFTKGKKRKFIDRWKIIEKEVANISRPFRDDYINDCNEYIKTTQSTVDNLKGNVSEVLSKENNSLSTETSDLDKRAQDEITAELASLATDMAGEIDNTLQTGVKDCSDTTIKLKDTSESTLKIHNKQYTDIINTHKQKTMSHYSNFDAEIKRKNENWLKDVDIKVNGAKKDCSDKIDGEIKLWNQESSDMNKLLGNMLDEHKNKYKSNAGTLQNSLSNTTRNTIQNIKDAIADFTLQFMNSIDDATELAETNEEKLKDIQTTSSSVPEISKVTTWHTLGKSSLVAAIKDIVYRTKSSIIIVSPIVIPELLQLISEFAYQRKAARFMLTSNWGPEYQEIIKKMILLGNIQFRSLTTQTEYFAVTRDAEEVILAPYTDNDAELISIVSNHPGYAKLYSQFIGPIFQANSRPIKL
jgi:hypothetical protein